MNGDVRRAGAALGVLVALGAGACGGSSSSDDGDGDDDGGRTAGTVAPTATTGSPAGEAPLVATAPCAGWTVEALAEGAGTVENAVVLDDGTVLLSIADRGQVARLDEDGTVTPLVEGLNAPGGLASDGEAAYVTTGLTVEATTGGTATGTIVRLDPATGHHEPWATGLVAPNGLAMLPDGGALTTRTGSGGATAADVMRVPPGGGDGAELQWSDLTSTNGAVLAPEGDAVYVTRSLSERAEVWRLPLDDPAAGAPVADLGVGTAVFLDDLTVAADGTLFAAAYAGGAVHRIDPATGEACAVATGLAQVTAVEVADGDHLVATSHTGTVSALRPPP